MDDVEYYLGLRERLKLNYGSARRMELLAWLQHARRQGSPKGIPVNKSHWPQLQEDPDLRCLLKIGRLRRIRSFAGLGKVRYTYLVLSGN